jgi:plastocyanin
MHAAAIHLVPVLAAEKSRTVFYIFAGLLVAWALVVSVVLGLRTADFPSSLGGQRIVSAVTAVLVIATAASGVITSGSPSKQSTAATPGTTTTTALPSRAANGTATGHSVSLQANTAGQLSYNTKTLSASAGAVTITMTNMSPLPHNVTIAQGTKELGATPTFQGGSKTLTLNLKPGTYTFYCSVPGHRQSGMEGTLTVS